MADSFFVVVTCVGIWTAAVYKCYDLSLLVASNYFGPCDATLGWGMVGNVCTEISGCDNHGYLLFDTEDECNGACGCRDAEDGGCRGSCGRYCQCLNFHPALLEDSSSILQVETVHCHCTSGAAPPCGSCDGCSDGTSTRILQ